MRNSVHWPLKTHKRNKKLLAMQHCSSSSSSSSKRFHYYDLIPDLTSMDSRMEQLRSCLPENVIGKSFNYSSRFGLGNLSAGASVYGSPGNPLFAAFSSTLCMNSLDYSSYFRLRNLTGGKLVYGCSGNPLLAAFRSALCMDSVPRPSWNRLLDDTATGLCPDLRSMDCMMQQLNSCVLKNVIAKSLDYSSNFGLRNLTAGEFVYGSSGNPLLAALRSTLCIDSVPLHRWTPLQDEVETGVQWPMVFIRSLEEAVGRTLCAPLNRVKLLLQNQGELIRTGRLSTPYLGIKDCLSRIIKKEGVLSLWKGNSIHLLGAVLREESRIFSLAQIDEIAFKSTKDEHQQMQLQKQLDAAASLGLYPCVYPVFYAYTRLANDIKCDKGNGERKFNSLLDLYKKTIKSDGIAGIFRGLNVGFLMLLIHQCDVLLQKQIHSEISEGNQAQATSFLATTNILVVYSLDTIQRRMMMTSGDVTKYKGSMDAVRQIIKNEGMKSLYKGFGAHYLGLIPLFLCAKWFEKMKDSNGNISLVIETK